MKKVITNVFDLVSGRANETELNNLYNKTINSSGTIDFTNSLIVESKITAVTSGGEFVNSIIKSLTI